MGPVAYRIALPSNMGQVHNVFHMSMLGGYLQDLSHIIDYHEHTLDDNLVYEEKPFQILDRQLKQLRNKAIPMVKVEWQEHNGKEAIWEREEEMKQRYLKLFST